MRFHSLDMANAVGDLAADLVYAEFDRAQQGTLAHFVCELLSSCELG
jgi:hypothetical protein